MFAEVEWDQPLLSTATTALLDHMSKEQLEAYVDVMRQLYSKVPELMESRGLIDGRGSRRFSGMVSLKAAITKPFSPITSYIPWSIPIAPIIILAPSEYSWNAGYLATWKDRLGTIGKIAMCIEFPNRDSSNLVSVYLNRLLLILI